MILRLFPQFRALELALQRERDAHSRSEDLRKAAEVQSRLVQAELTFWKAKVGERDAEIHRLNDRLVETAQKVADTMSIHAIGKRVFSKAPDQPPVGAQQQVPVQHRMTAREAAWQQTKATKQALAKMYAELPELPTDKTQ